MNISMEHMDHILLQQVQQAQAAAAAHQQHQHQQQQHAQAQAQAHQHAQALQHHQQQQMLHAQAVAQHNAAQQHAHAQHLAQLSQQQHAHTHTQHTQHTQHAQQLAQHNALSHAQHAHTHTQLAHAMDVSAQHTQHTQHTHGTHPSHAQHTQQQLAQHTQHTHTAHTQHAQHTQHTAHTPHSTHTQHAQLAQEAVGSSSSSASSAVNNNNTNNSNNSALGSSEDPRLQVFRKLSKTLKPAVLLKSWQRVCMLVAGIEAQRDNPQASIAMLEKEIYDRYHGNVHRDPPIVGTVKRAIDDQLDCLALDKFGVKFPKDKISYVQMTAGMPGHTIWRYYKELVSDVANKINLVYRQCLCEDLSLPEGKSLFDALEETLRVLWTQNEEVRKERITKRDGDRRCPDDSDSERDSVTHAPPPMGVPVAAMGVGHAVNVNHGVSVGHPVGVNGAPMGVGVNVPVSVSVPVPVGVSVPVGNAANDERDRHGSGRKKSSPGSLMNAKPFPGVGKYQPIAFLSFLLMGPPAGERCYARFALDAHLEAAPPRPRGVNVGVSPVGVGVGVSGVPVGVGVGVGVPVGVPVNALARGMMEDAHSHAHHYDGFLARSHSSAGGSNGPDRKRMKKDNGSLTGVVSVSGAPQGHAHAQAHTQGGTQGHAHTHAQQGMLEEENEAIRIFNAETAARAQRLEELKLALSLFPDDENIKAELKQFVDSQRRTSLSLSVSVDGVSGAVLPPM